MAKVTKPIYVCQGCGYQTPKWMGRCPDCGQWNAFVEEPVESGTKRGKSYAMGDPKPIDAISLDPELRLRTGIAEFDRTLGGGVIPGSLVLIGGDPGITVFRGHACSAGTRPLDGLTAASALYYGGLACRLSIRVFLMGSALIRRRAG